MNPQETPPVVPAAPIHRQAVRGLGFGLPARWTALWISLEWTRVATIGLWTTLALYVLGSYASHGISNDEEVQHIYGRLLLAFYGSGFADHSAFDYKNLYLYGGLFDLIAAGLEQVLPMNLWDMRHLLSGLFGLTGLAAVFQWSRLIAGEKTGIVAVVVLALTGAWLGGMFTHTKDVPFAACMAWAGYYTTRVLQRLPAPPLRQVLKLGAAIGLAFGLRVGAVFAVFYLGCGIVAAALLLGGPTLSDKLRFALRSIRNLWPAAWVAFGLMAVFWPWVVMSPGNLIEAATTFSHFSFNLYTVVDGVPLKNGAVPATYLLQYLQVRLPELALLGIAAGILLLPKAVLHLRPGLETDRRKVLLMLPLALAILVPLAFTLATTPALYNGVRHFTFLLPPLAILAAIGLRGLWYWAIRLQYGALTTLSLCGGLACFNLGTLVQLHPYEYVAYNELFAGGLTGAKDKWELDYWSDSVRESSNELTAFVKAEGKILREPYLVAVCAESMQADEWLGPQFKLTSNWLKADFYISTTHMGCDKVMKGDVIGTVEREGIKLAVLKDRRNLLPIDRIPH